MIVPHSVETGNLNEKLVYRTAQISNPAAAAAAATATEAFNPQAFITCYNKADLMINALVNTYEDNGWQLPEMSILLNSQAVERNFRLRPASDESNS